MRPVNIFALTRIDEPSLIRKMERQLSGRDTFLPVKEWEIESVKCLCASLSAVDKASERVKYYYSFQVPKLGKEFDLLRIADNTVLNIELKSRPVSDEAIRKQLQLNREYLAALSRPVRSYTFVSETKKLYRMTQAGYVIDASWEELWQDILEQKNVYDGPIETLFKEDTYLISPLTEPDRFLRREYFLTAQQFDVRKRILKNIESKTTLFQGFTGYSGTGKTLLLYDLAVRLSSKERVAVLHYGNFPAEICHLNDQLKRVDFIHSADSAPLPDFAPYAAILVDETQYMLPNDLFAVKKAAENTGTPVIFTYDRQDIFAPAERRFGVVAHIDELPGFISYRLTNRIRVNEELSSFMNAIFCRKFEVPRKTYPSVSVGYANDEQEASSLISAYGTEGYVYLYDGKAGGSLSGELSSGEFSFDIRTLKSGSYDRVVLVIGPHFWYDDDGFLRSPEIIPSENESIASGMLNVRILYRAMAMAKKKLAIVVVDNKPVLEALLQVLQ